MANPQVIAQIASTFFQRNNPINTLLLVGYQAYDFVVNFNSHRKLMKYRFLLYKQQMSSIEKNLHAGARSAQGYKVDRFY